MSALTGAFSRLRISRPQEVAREPVAPMQSRPTTNVSGRQYTVQHMTSEEYAKLGDQITQLNEARRNIAAASVRIAEADAKSVEAEAQIARGTEQMQVAQTSIDANNAQMVEKLSLFESKLTQMRPGFETNTTKLQNLDTLAGKVADFKVHVAQYSGEDQKKLLQQITVDFKALVTT